MLLYVDYFFKRPPDVTEDLYDRIRVFMERKRENEILFWKLFIRENEIARLGGIFIYLFM